MQPRVRAFRRVLDLYIAIEEMHAIEMERLRVGVREAEQAITVERYEMVSANQQRREALLLGDRVGCKTSETRQRGAVSRGKNLERIYLERCELTEAARTTYISSRLRREQIAHVLEELVEEIEIEGQRRSQAAADDRYISRRRWAERREETQQQ